MDWPEPRYVVADGVHLATYVIGDGPATIVAPSPYFFPAHLCAEVPAVVEFLERIIQFARLVVFDHRGSGLSDPLGPDPSTGIEGAAREILAVVEAAADGRAHLWTYGLGSAASFVAAALAPDKIESVTAVSSSAQVRPTEGYPHGVRDEVYEGWVASILGSAEAASMESVILPNGAESDRRLIRRAGAQGASPASAMQLVELLVGFDARPHLDEVACPVLVVHSEGDPFFPVEGARDLVACLPDGRLELFEGADHALVLMHPSRLADLVEEFLTGAAGASDRRRKLVTVVFTDVVASTERASAMGDAAWRTLLDTFDTAVRNKTTAYGGTTVKFTGDGHLLVFDTPGAALRAAREVGRLARERGLELRTGVHTGEVELMGDDVTGTAVVIAARVMALADAGEVYATSTVVDLVEGSDHEWDDQGEHVLKGIPRPKTLYRLR